MKEQVWQLDEIVKLVSRSLALIVLAVLFFAGLAVVVTFYIPSKYRAQAMLSIQSSYFQNPLVKEMIAEEIEPDELRSQRFALLRMALTSDFIDQLGERYGIYQYPAEHYKRGIEREQLLQNIEYYTEGPTAVASGAFYVTVAAPTGQAAYAMTRDVLERMLSTLFEHRQNKLVHTRQSIEKQLVLLGQFLKENYDASGSPVARGEDALNTELRRIKSELSALLRHYTDLHPIVVKKQQQLDALQKQVDRFDLASGLKDNSAVDATSVVLSASAAQGRLQEVYNDLITKLSNLDVVLRIESKREDFAHVTVIEQPTLPLRPVFPSKRIFAVLGGFIGLLFSVMVILIREVKRAAVLVPEHIPDQLGLPLLGELPPFVSFEKAQVSNGIDNNGASVNALSSVASVKRIGETLR